MSVIAIKSEDIYDKSNHNILSTNAISGVSLTPKELSASSSESEMTIAEDITQTVDGVDFTDNNDDYVVALDYKDGRFTRIEAYYSTFQFTVSNLYEVTEQTLKFISTVKYIKRDSPKVLSRHPVLNDNPIESYAYWPDYLTFGDEDEFSEATQEGLFGDNGVVEGTYRYSYGLYDKVSVSLTLEQTVTITDNGDGNYLVTVKYPTKVNWAYGYYGTTYATWYFVEFYQVESIDVYLQASDFSISDSQKVIKVGSFSADTNSFAVDVNSLIQASATYGGSSLTTTIAQEILDDWGTGKESVTLQVMVGEFYDYVNEELLISTKDETLPMMFEVGDVVVPYVVDAEGNDIVLSENGEGVPKRFRVISVNPSDDGVCFQTLTLLETENYTPLAYSFSLKISDYTTQIISNYCTFTTRRTSSDTAGAYTGTIDTEVYVDDALTTTYRVTWEEIGELYEDCFVTVYMNSELLFEKASFGSFTTAGEVYGWKSFSYTVSGNANLEFIFTNS